MIEKQIAEHEYFRTSDGKVLPSLIALRAYLRTIPLKEFESHTQGKNDFAQWVEHTFDEHELAEKLRACSTREQMVWVLDDVFGEMHIQRVMADKEELPPSPPVNNQLESADPFALREDDRFDKYRAELIERNESVSKKYEDIAKDLQDALLNPTPKEIEQLNEQLKNRYAQIATRISEARRLGKDMLMATLVLRQFTPKMTFAIASREAKDFQFAKVILDEAEFELREAESRKETNFRDEVLALAKQ